MTTKNLNNSENSELGFDNIFFSDMSESSDTIDSGEIKVHEYSGIKGIFRLTLWIPTDAVGKVIGKKGTVISHIQRTTFTEVTILSLTNTPTDVWSPLVITGEPSNSFKAFHLIKDIVEGEVDDIVVEFPMLRTHKIYHGIFYGHHHIQFQTLSASTSTRIFIPDFRDVQFNHNSNINVNITLEGEHTGVEKAFIQIAQIMSDPQYYSPPKSAHDIIVKNTSRTTGVVTLEQQIDVPSNLVGLLLRRSYNGTGGGNANSKYGTQPPTSNVIMQIKALTNTTIIKKQNVLEGSGNTNANASGSNAGASAGEDANASSEIKEIFYISGKVERDVENASNSLLRIVHGEKILIVMSELKEAYTKPGHGYEGMKGSGGDVGGGLSDKERKPKGNQNNHTINGGSGDVRSGRYEGGAGGSHAYAKGYREVRAVTTSTVTNSESRGGDDDVAVGSSDRNGGGGGGDKRGTSRYDSSSSRKVSETMKRVIAESVNNSIKYNDNTSNGKKQQQDESHGTTAEATSTVTGIGTAIGTGDVNAAGNTNPNPTTRGDYKKDRKGTGGGRGGAGSGRTNARKASDSSGADAGKEASSTPGKDATRGGDGGGNTSMEAGGGASTAVPSSTPNRPPKSSYSTGSGKAGYSTSPSIPASDGPRDRRERGGGGRGGRGGERAAGSENVPGKGGERSRAKPYFSTAPRTDRSERSESEVKKSESGQATSVIS